MSGFIALHRRETSFALLKKFPSAFLLLCQISMRARWKNDPCPVSGLVMGEAFIGDFKSAGLKSEKAYRNAKERLEKVGLCAFRRAEQGAERGTIATLLNEDVFSISDTEGAEQRAEQGRSKGGARAIKNKVTRKHGNKPLNPQGEIWAGIFPKGSLSKSRADQRRIKVSRNNPKMIHVGKWFDRKEDTLWTVAEARILQDLNPDREEVELMAKYRETPSEFHRRDIFTLLNNWHTELDRARTAGNHKSEDRAEKQRTDAQERRAV